MTKYIRNTPKKFWRTLFFCLKENSISPAGGLSSCLQQKKNNDFFTFILHNTPSKVDFNRTSHVIWTLMLNDRFSNRDPHHPHGPRAPSPFRQNIVKQSHGGAVLCGEQPAVLGTAVSQPTSPALPARARGSRPAPAITGSHCPIPSFLAEPLTPPYLSGAVSHHRISEDHLGK